MRLVLGVALMVVGHFGSPAMAQCRVSIGPFAYIRALPSMPDRPALYAADLCTNGSGVNEAKVTEFSRLGPNGPVDDIHPHGIAISPNGERIAFTFSVDLGVAAQEYHTAIIHEDHGYHAQVEDLAYEAEVSQICGQSGPYHAMMEQNTLASGGFPAGATVRMDVVDSDGSYFRLSRWLADGSLEFQALVQFNLIVIPGPQLPEVDLGNYFENLHILMRPLSSSSADWRVVACQQAAFAIDDVHGRVRVDLGAAMSSGQEMEWKGRPILSQSGRPISPDGALMVAGPPDL